MTVNTNLISETTLGYLSVNELPIQGAPKEEVRLEEVRLTIKQQFDALVQTETPPQIEEEEFTPVKPTTIRRSKRWNNDKDKAIEELATYMSRSIRFGDENDITTPAITEEISSFCTSYNLTDEDYDRARQKAVDKQKDNSVSAVYQRAKRVYKDQDPNFKSVFDSDDD